MADIIRCKNCGKHIPTTINVCPYCNKAKTSTSDGGISLLQMIGIVALFIGILWCMWAFNMNTTIDTPIGKVNNLGLMDDRRNMITISAIVILVGALFTAFGGKTVGVKS